MKEQSPFAIRAEIVSEQMISTANRNIENHCHNKGIRKADFINAIKAMGLKSFSSHRVPLYNPETKNHVKTTDLSELCIIAVVMEINPVTLLIGEVKRSRL